MPHGGRPTPCHRAHPGLASLDAKRAKASHKTALFDNRARLVGLCYTQPPARARLSNYLNDRMFRLISTLRLQRRVRIALSLALCLFLRLAAAPAVRAQLIRLPSGQGEIVEISADGPQKKQGDLFIADQNVLIKYGEISLRADHVEYNNKNHEATATGHIIFDYDTQHIEASQAQYNLSTGTGKFHEVHGNVKISRKPNPMVLTTENPLHFEARDVDKLPGDVYIVRQAWITVCDPEHPKWQFFARRARIRLDKNVALVNANFRLFRVPLVWVPYATAPAGQRVRETGFLLPDI